MLNFILRSYNKYRRSVSDASYGVYKATLTNIMALIMVVSLGLFYSSAIAYNLTVPPAQAKDWPSPVYLIVVLMNLAVLLVRQDRRVIRQIREHAVVISLIIIVILTDIDVHDITQEGMYMIMIIFLVGFITKPIYTFPYTFILGYIFLLIQDLNYNDFTILLVWMTFGFIGMISFLLSLTTFLLFESHKRNMYQLQLLYENDKKLFSNLAHRLKTPLTVLQAEAKLYQRSNKQVNTRINHVIEDIRQSIDELTELSKMNLSKMSGKVTEVDLVELIKSIAKDGEMLAQNYAQIHRLKRHVIWQTKFDTAIIHTSRDQIRESLLNLIDNSIRHNTAKDDVTVTVKLTRSVGNYIISVIDNGVGIPEDEFKNILNRKGLNDDDSDNYHQHIGLEISRNLVSANNGKLNIFSQEGEGTTIQISLPINV